MSTIIYSYPNSEEVASNVAKYILNIQNRCLSESSTFKIAISGGSLGKVLKKGLIDNHEISAKIKWAQWEVYFSDERLVPLNHEDSNYKLFNDMVLKNLSHDKPKVFTIDESLLVGTDGQVSEGSEAQDEAIAAVYSGKLPTSFNLILLGCGPDGHTCSLFPGHALVKENNKLVANISDSPKPPPRRITVTFPVLKNAENIAFVAEGAGKASILKEIFVDKQSQLPSKLVNDLDINVSWFVDDNAVNGVDVVTSKY